MLRKVQFVKDMARTKCLTVNYSVIITPTNTVRYIDCCMLILFCPFFTKKKKDNFTARFYPNFYDTGRNITQLN